MLAGDARALLDSPAFAVLTTLTATGRPQSGVMWYRLAGDQLRMIAPASSAKARNLRQPAPATVVVLERDNPYHYLEIRGVADAIHDDRAARDELRLIAARYIGERAEHYVDALSADPRVIIVITPERARHHRGAAIPPGD